MENKKFSELKVGDRLSYYENRLDEYRELKIKEIVKIKKSLLIFCELGNFCVIKFLINNTEDDFCIIDLNCMEIWQAISTSMDRLLLEVIGSVSIVWG